MCCTNTQGTKLFIGNLPLSATVDGLRAIVAQFGNVEEIVVLHRTSPSGNRCGFVRFSDVETAQKARVGISATCYPGADVAMVARPADRTRTPRGPSNATDFTKLFVGNLSTEVSEIELWEMFAQFGEVLDVVVMRKASMSGCRCAFVRFSASAAAGMAVDHLHGMKNSAGVPLVVRIADPSKADFNSTSSQSVITPTTSAAPSIAFPLSNRSSPHSTMCSTPPLSPTTFSEASNTPPSSPGPRHMLRASLLPVPTDDAPFLLPMSMCIGRQASMSAVAVTRQEGQAMSQYSAPTYQQEQMHYASKADHGSSCYPTSSMRPDAVPASGLKRWVYQHDPYSFAAFADDASSQMW